MRYYHLFGLFLRCCSVFFLHHNYCFCVLIISFFYSFFFVDDVFFLSTFYFVWYNLHFCCSCCGCLVLSLTNVTDKLGWKLLNATQKSNGKEMNDDDDWLYRNDATSALSLTASMLSWWHGFELSFVNGLLLITRLIIGKKNVLYMIEDS